MDPSQHHTGPEADGIDQGTTGSDVVIQDVSGTKRRPSPLNLSQHPREGLSKLDARQSSDPAQAASKPDCEQFEQSEQAEQRQQDNSRAPPQSGGRHGQESNGLLGNLLRLDQTRRECPPSAGETRPIRKPWYGQARSLSYLDRIFSGTQDGPTSPASIASSMTLAPTLSPTKRRDFQRRQCEEEIRIQIKIADIISRQRYILDLCRSLMAYGAPTHRLENYLINTAGVLELDAAFLYLPGCTIISFQDGSTHTSEVKLIRVGQGINLKKLRSTCDIYRDVVHNLVGVDDALLRIHDVGQDKEMNEWWRVLAFGLACTCVGPFGFNAQIKDLPIIWLLGTLIGVLTIVVVPRSDIFSHVFEISASILASFLGRAFGSIGGNDVFCFSALTQSSIAMILPGCLVLSAVLELQSHNLVPGAVRMLYAIIYSLFLGYGMTLGTVLYGLMDANAVTTTVCAAPVPAYYRFFFVPAFALCLCFLHQAAWDQVPATVILALAGYVVNFFSTRAISPSPEIANTLGALTVGLGGNLYSRLRPSVTSCSLLPAIFVQVPGGLTAMGSLLQGLDTANKLKMHGNETSHMDVDHAVGPHGISFRVALSMIEIALGLSAGLFFSTLIIYPRGKKGHTLFTL